MSDANMSAFGCGNGNMGYSEILCGKISYFFATVTIGLDYHRKPRKIFICLIFFSSLDAIRLCGEGGEKGRMLVGFSFMDDMGRMENMLLNGMAGA